MINPVLRREIRTSLRTWRTFIVIMLYVLILAGVSGIYLLLLLGGSYYSGFSPQSAGYLYLVLSGFQLGLILLIVPALTGGAISSERERQTLDLMLLTKMSPVTIVIGKLISSMLVVLLLIASSVPVFAVMLYYGGVSVLNLFQMALFTVVTAVLTGGLAILLSSILKRTVAAMVVTYIVILLLSLGSFVFVLIFNRITYAFFDVNVLSGQMCFWILSVNPFMGFASVIDSQIGTNSVMSIIESAAYDYASGTYWSGYVYPMWVANILMSIFLTCVALLLAARFIQPVHGKRRGKNEGH